VPPPPGTKILRTFVVSALVQGVFEEKIRHLTIPLRTHISDTDIGHVINAEVHFFSELIAYIDEGWRESGLVNCRTHVHAEAGIGTVSTDTL